MTWLLWLLFPGAMFWGLIFRAAKGGKGKRNR